DIRLAEEVASRAALAVANARLFGQARRTAAALATSEERHRTLTEALPQLVWQSRPDGQVDYFNRQWSAYTGLPATEALGWGWTQVIHEDDLSATVTGWTHALVAAADFVAELRLRRHDGTYRWHLA